MKRQHIETTLTLIWHHDSALLEDFSVFWTTFFSHLCRQSALTSVFWLTLFPFPRLTVCLCTVRRLCKHIEPLPLCALHLIFIWSMKADGMPSSQTPCVKPVVSLLKICSVGRPDLTQSHIANRRCKSLIRLFSPPCRSVFYSSSLLFSFIKERRPYSRLHSIWAGVPTSILAEFNYAFPPFFFSRSHSPKALKLLLSFFHNNVPDIINLSQCSFRTVLCVCDRGGGGAGGEDWYKWHQSQAGSSLGLPSDAAFYGGGSPSCWCLQPVSASLLSPLCSLNLRDPSLGRFSYLILGVIKIKR